MEGAQSSPRNDEPDLLNFEIDLLVIAKKIGLSFEELKELRVTDLFAMAESFTGADKEKPREATQADIDAFFGR